eukprot:TRINITY_DN64476_c1_g1_i3.p1 TRINITY_DN64476_c1_g1~~TRINITY_DN64476_c1_g1_i3.p1  ORF type:complete len:785 (-),score=88.61 TRINITY_DN64476_c1_g1_i3:86-2440(-)
MHLCTSPQHPTEQSISGPEGPEMEPPEQFDEWVEYQEDYCRNNLELHEQETRSLIYAMAEEVRHSSQRFEQTIRRQQEVLREKNVEVLRNTRERSEVILEMDKMQEKLCTEKLGLHKRIQELEALVDKAIDRAREAEEKQRAAERMNDTVQFEVDAVQGQLAQMLQTREDLMQQLKLAEDKQETTIEEVQQQEALITAKTKALETISGEFAQLRIAHASAVQQNEQLQARIALLTGQDGYGLPGRPVSPSSSLSLPPSPVPPPRAHPPTSQHHSPPPLSEGQAADIMLESERKCRETILEAWEDVQSAFCWISNTFAALKKMTTRASKTQKRSVQIMRAVGGLRLVTMLVGHEEAARTELIDHEAECRQLLWKRSKESLQGHAWRMRIHNISPATTFVAPDESAKKLADLQLELAEKAAHVDTLNIQIHQLKQTVQNKTRMIDELQLRNEANEKEKTAHIHYHERPSSHSNTPTPSLVTSPSTQPNRRHSSRTPRNSVGGSSKRSDKENRMESPRTLLPSNTRNSGALTTAQITQKYDADREASKAKHLQHEFDALTRRYHHLQKQQKNYQVLFKHIFHFMLRHWQSLELHVRLKHIAEQEASERSITMARFRAEMPGIGVQMLKHNKVLLLEEGSTSPTQRNIQATVKKADVTQHCVPTPISTYTTPTPTPIPQPHTTRGRVGTAYGSVPVAGHGPPNVSFASPKKGRRSASTGCILTMTSRRRARSESSTDRSGTGVRTEQWEQAIQQHQQQQQQKLFQQQRTTNDATVTTKRAQPSTRRAN